MEPMKREWLFGVAAAAATGLALAAVGPAVLGGTLAAAAGVGALGWLGRCRHGGKLGLLPPTAAADGNRLPARWYCDLCGRSWPAGFEHDSKPIVRFAGYDPTKLPAAARRAATLEKQRQLGAVRRAGLEVRQADASSPGGVTSITDRRAG
jgi:hypothetical protein